MLNKNRKTMTSLPLYLGIIFCAFYGTITLAKNNSTIDNDITNNIINASNVLRHVIFAAPLFTTGTAPRFIPGNTMIDNKPVLNNWNMLVNNALKISLAQASIFPASKTLQNAIHLCQDLKKSINTLLANNNTTEADSIKNLTDTLKKNIETVKHTNFYLGVAHKKNAQNTCIIIGEYLIKIAETIIQKVKNYENIITNSQQSFTRSTQAKNPRTASSQTPNAHLRPTAAAKSPAPTQATSGKEKRQKAGTGKTIVQSTKTPEEAIALVEFIRRETGETGQLTETQPIKTATQQQQSTHPYIQYPAKLALSKTAPPTRARATRQAGTVTREEFEKNKKEESEKRERKRLEKITLESSAKKENEEEDDDEGEYFA